jgi:hypothetical protein
MPLPPALLRAQAEERGIALTEARATALAADLARLEAALAQASAALDFDSSPDSFARILDAAAPR